jgi:hypothetical protein
VKDDYMLAASNLILGPSQQENSQENLINLFIALIVKGDKPSSDMLSTQLKDTHKCFIITAIYYYLVYCEITTLAVGEKPLPTDISDNIHAYLGIGSKSLYEKYIINLMSYGKTDYLEELNTLFRGKYDLNDIKRVCLDIIAYAESRATPKNRPIIENIRYYITNHNHYF